MGIYAGDSFFTLGPGGQAGLVAVSLALAALALAATWRLARRAGSPRRVLVGLGVALAFEWLSPQVYYGYYRMIFDDLPLQWVLRTPDPGATLDIMLFRGRPTLAAHGRAVLYWACLAVALLAERRGPWRTGNPPDPS